MDGAARLLAQFGFGRSQHFVTAPADVDGGAKFEEALSGGFAESGAAARDENAFVEEQIALKHESPRRRLIVSKGSRNRLAGDRITWSFRRGRQTDSSASALLGAGMIKSQQRAPDRAFP